MKFWQKIFFGTLIIFIVIFDAGTFVITSYSYDFSLKRETDNGVREHGVILSSVQSGISNAEQIYKKAPNNNKSLFAVIYPLATYYNPQGILLALFNGEDATYSSGPDIDKNLLRFQNESTMNIADKKIGGIRYLFVASKIPGYGHLTFVYARNINELDIYRKEMGSVFFKLNIAVCFILGIAIFLFLKRMTRPIKKLNEITNEIATGAYGKRVDIRRKDELGELGRTFNIMADSVEANILRLTKTADEKQQLIDSLAHEIKTPLTSILGYSEFLQNANSSEENSIIAAGHLHDAAQRLHLLSVKLLDITFLRGEQIDSKELKIDQLFSSLTHLSQPMRSGKKLRLETKSEIDCIWSDETLIISLLTNLIENAARASFEDGIITVSAYFDAYPVIAVADTGCGMKEEETEKITEPFYRVDKSRSRSFGGVGLGLSICRQIADLHGAKLDIISKPDVGTTVRIIFYNSITT